MYRICATDDDKVLDKAARTIGEMILGRSGATIAKVADREITLMPSWMKAAHERGAEEFAAHQDRPDRTHALTMSQHRELAREHEVRAYEQSSAGNRAGAEAHQAAADAHARAAALASDQHADFTLVSHRAREATRRANRLCQDPLQIPGHAAKGAGGDGFSAPAGRTRGADTNFGSRAVEEPRYREPRSNPYAFHTSGRVSGGPREAGDDNSPAQPVHPLAFLLDPVNDPRQMNWSREDLGSAPGERHAGIDYNPSRPAKAAGAGYDPNEPLVAMAKRMMGGSAPIAKSLDLAHELTVKGSLREGAYRSILKFRDWKRRSSETTWQALKRDDAAEYGQTIAAIRSAPISQSDRETLLASIA
jgi:hypothetical protein